MQGTQKFCGKKMVFKVKIKEMEMNSEIQRSALEVLIKF